MNQQKQVAPAPVQPANSMLDQVLEATQAALVRPEFVQMKLENDTIMSETRVRPRDFAAIKVELASQVEAFPAMAESAIYSKPVGKDQRGQMKFARGLSIRAAELLAEAYGFNRIRSDVSTVDGDHIKIEATFTDFQKGRIWQDGGILSMFYRSSRGQTTRYAEDRFFSVVVKAECSRRIREVILRSVNAGLKAWFEDLCEKKLGSLLDGPAVQKIVDAFAVKGVSVQMLEEFLGRPQAMGWTNDDRKHLQGVWNSVLQGETTIEEVFGIGNGHGQPKQPGVSLNDLINPKEAAASQADSQSAGGAALTHAGVAAAAGKYTPSLADLVQERLPKCKTHAEIDQAHFDFKRHPDYGNPDVAVLVDSNVDQAKRNLVGSPDLMADLRKRLSGVTLLRIVDQHHTWAKQHPGYAAAWKDVDALITETKTGIRVTKGDNPPPAKKDLFQPAGVGPYGVGA